METFKVSFYSQPLASVGWVTVARCGRAPPCSPAGGRRRRGAPALSPLLWRRGGGASLGSSPLLRGALLHVRRGAAALLLLLRRRAVVGEARRAPPGSSDGGGDGGEARPLSLSSSGGGEAWPRSSWLLRRWSCAGEARPHSLCSSVGWAGAPPCSPAAGRRRRGAPALSPLLWRRGGGASLGSSPPLARRSPPRVVLHLLPIFLQHAAPVGQCSPLALLGRSMKIALGSIFEGRFPGAGRFSRGLFLN
jgi:hypothetical protein